MSLQINVGKQGVMVVRDGDKPDVELEIEVDAQLSPLSKAENKVLTLFPTGMSRQDMADFLHRSFPTINTHIHHVLQKSGAGNIAEAVAIAMMRGYLTIRQVKARNLIIAWLAIISGGNALLPSEAYAQEFNDWSVPPVEFPVNRVRVRGGAQVRVGTRLNLRSPTRRWEG